MRKARAVVYIPFSGYDRESGGWRFNKSLANREWWDEREQVTGNYTLPSLFNQTRVDFNILAGFTRHIPDGYSDDMQTLLLAAGVNVIEHTTQPGDIKLPIAHLKEKHPNEDILWIHLDSDDMYHTTAIENLLSKQSEGQCTIFKNGYTYDTKKRLLAEYNTDVCPPPFFSYFITKEALEDSEKLKSYMKHYGMDKPHFKLREARNVLEYKERAFCWTSNGSNIESNWEHKSHKKRLGRIYDYMESAEILQTQFGVGYV